MSEVFVLDYRRQFQRELEDKNKEIKKIIKDAIRPKLRGRNIEISISNS
jgi:hypothetical protein